MVKKNEERKLELAMRRLGKIMELATVTPLRTGASAQKSGD
jgi:hypothetical protein